MKIWAPIESIVSFFKNTFKKFGKKNDNKFYGRSTITVKMSEEEAELHFNRIQIQQINKMNDEKFRHNPFDDISVDKIKNNFSNKSKKKKRSYREYNTDIEDYKES